MSTKNTKKLRAIKSLIIPKLPPNFHESLFFTEIQYQKNPSNHLKKYLINLYIQGVDYYATTNQKDLSLYFETKLLNIMKSVDYFEKITSKKFDENDLDTLVESQKEKILNQEKNIENNIDNFLKEQLKGQQDQFLTKLNMKKKLMRFKRINSVNIKRKSVQTNTLDFNKNKISTSQLNKKVSIDLTSSLFPKENDKNKTSNNVFSKVENALNGLDRINTLLIIEYTKKLRQYMKNELQSMNERIDKYNEYIKTKNELNIIYDEIEDKNGEEAKGIREQIDIVKKEWEEFNKKNIGENDKYSDIAQMDEKNLDNFLDNLYKKIEDISIK